MSGPADPLADPLRELAVNIATGRGRAEPSDEDVAAAQLMLDDGDGGEWDLEDLDFDPTAVADRKGKARNRGEGGQSEAAFTTETLNALNARPGHRAQKVTPGPSGGEGEPDIDGCALTRYGLGRSFKIELKVGTKRPTDVQQARLLQWQQSGALVGWATSIDEVWQILAHVNDPDYRWVRGGPSGAPPVSG